MIGALLCVGALTGACTEQILVSSVVVVDPNNGDELDRRSRPGLSGSVRVAATPAGMDDALAWGLGDVMELRHQGEWQQMDLQAEEFNLLPTSGQTAPEVYGVAGTQAFLWSSDGLSMLAQVETHPRPFDLLAADWDGDGDADLVAAAPDFGVWYHAREGDELLEAQPIVESIGLDQRIAVGDLDQDGHLDIVRPDSGAVDIAFAEFDGYIDEVISVAALVDDVEEVSVGDISGDGNLDVVIGARDGIQVLENDGDRSLSTRYHFPEMVTQMELMDVDGDGDLDIVGQPPPPDPSESWGKQLLIARNEDGTLADPEPLFESPESVVDLTAGRDEDGTPWLAMSTFTYRTVQAEPERRD
jgi:hypothetical protein